MINWSKLWATINRRPYVEIVSDSIDPETGFELALDWNELFISELAKAGIDGDCDEDMVQLWLQSIMRTQDLEGYEENLMDLAKEETLRHARDQQEP